MNEQAIQEVIRAFSDTELLNFARASIQEKGAMQTSFPLSIPDEFDRDLMRDFLACLRKIYAKPVYEHEDTWVVVTDDMRRILLDIETITSDTATLTNKARGYIQAGHALQPAIEEIAHCLQEDGVETSYEEVRASFTDSNPRPDLVGTVCKLFVEAISSSESEIDQYPLAVHESLTSFAETHQHYFTPCSPTSFPDERMNELAARRRHLLFPDVIADTVEAELDEARKIHLPELIKAILLIEEMRDYRPFATLNSTTGLLVRCWIYNRIGLPGLSFVPLAKSADQWRKGTAPESSTIIDNWDGLQKSMFGYDATLFFQQMLSLYYRGVREVEGIISIYERKIEGLKRNADADARLNLRQKELVKHLIEKQKEEVDSFVYAKEFAVTAVTARADLGRLLDLGYLSCRYSGRTALYKLRTDALR